MPSCVGCGLDINTEGLCPECDEAKNKTRTQPAALHIIIFALICLFSGFIGVLIGSSIVNSRIPEIAVNVPRQIEEKTVISEEKDPPAKVQEIFFDLSQREKHPPLDDKETYVNWMLNNTTKEEKKFLEQRWDCVQDLINWKSIQDDRVKEAMLLTPRENFIRKQNRDRAYEHAYMAIGYGATITDPWVVSKMTQAINPAIDHKVLEIGTGSGYQSAILSQLSNFVYSIEIISPLAKETDALYKSYTVNYPEYQNIRRKHGDGYFGWKDYAPFDRIIVTCAIDHIPPALLKQLKPGGIMVIPVGPPSGQRLLKISKKVKENGDIWYEREDIFAGGVKFIPFTSGEGGSYSLEEEK